jgi:hypothetical protein
LWRVLGETGILQNVAKASAIILGESDLIRCRVQHCFLAAAILAAVGYAQNPSSEKPSKSPDEARSEMGKVPSSKHVVIRVGNTEVTEEDFETRIKDIEGEGAEGDRTEQKQRKRLGDDYASVLVLSQQAVASHLDTTPEIRRKLEISRLQTLSDAEFAKLMEQSRPSQEEVTRYYKANLEEFSQVKLRRLFIWKRGPESKNKRGLAPEVARAKADAILKTSASGRDANSLADAFKDSPDGLLDSTVLTFPRGELPPVMEAVAFGSPEGKWTQVQDSADSISLILVVKRNPQQIGEVTSLIEQRLQNLKMQAKLDELKKNAGIWMDERYFGTASGRKDGKSRSGSNAPTKSEESTGTGEGKNEQ